MASAGVTVRPLRESDLAEADRIMRLAFGTFLGLADPAGFMGDADYVRTRWAADPTAALAAEVGGRLAGPNFVTPGGPGGFLGPPPPAPGPWGKRGAPAPAARTLPPLAR